MCGISGILKLSCSTRTEFNKSHIIEMTKALSHRGPDNSDIWEEDNVFLGHTRLSILDLSSKGNQPMISRSQRFVITFNGEIYNYKELKSKLNLDKDWNGNSDTEVLLECIEAWGIDKTLNLSRGMFAFAVWDRVKKKITLARDRVGEKPLYYGFVNGQFIFASELKSIKVFKKFGLEENIDAMNLMIKFGYIPSPFSIYKNIFKLKAGTKLEISSHSKIHNISQWWNRSLIFNQHKSTELSDVLEKQLHQTLSLVIREQMVSDVPIGAFLSGGIDSSLIVALMQEQSIKKINTFTIGFSEVGYDEAKYANEISKILGTEHHEFYISPKEAIDLIPKIPDVYDEPFADSSQIPTMLISKLTSNHVKVCLSGDGGDELFGGYNRYLWSNTIINTFDTLPLKLRNFISLSCKSIPANALTKSFNFFSNVLPSNLRFPNIGDKVHKFGELIKYNSKEDLYLKMISQWQEYLPATDKMENIKSWGDNISYIENMMKTDLIMYLPDDILVKLDRAAMSYGLETRVPFLDKRIIETAWKIPMNKKIINKRGKIPLRNILKKYIPEHLIERPKQGFGVPIDSWLRGPLKEWANELLDEKKIKNGLFINSELISKRWKEHLNGESNWHYPIWNILMLQSWLEKNKL